MTESNVFMNIGLARALMRYFQQTDVLVEELTFGSGCSGIFLGLCSAEITLITSSQPCKLHHMAIVFVLGLLTRKEISRFSPPQMSMPSSYSPSSWKYRRSMANRPPAMVGELHAAQRVRGRRIQALLYTQAQSNKNWPCSTQAMLQMRQKLVS